MGGGWVECGVGGGFGRVGLRAICVWWKRRRGCCGDGPGIRVWGKSIAKVCKCNNVAPVLFTYIHNICIPLQPKPNTSQLSSSPLVVPLPHPLSFHTSPQAFFTSSLPVQKSPPQLSPRCSPRRRSHLLPSNNSPVSLLRKRRTEAATTRLRLN